jgi:hypothetical protein
LAPASTLGVLAIVVADIPSTGALRKFAHAVLSLAVVLDPDHGELKAKDAQLAPASFILNPSCHFTGRAHISVGVGFQLTINIINKLLSAKVSADLELWGWPLAGRVHVD